MTHSIGTGTKNLSADVPTDEWDALKAAAQRQGVRLGELIRTLLLTGAEQTDPQAAAQIRNARRQYYGAIIAGLFLGHLLVGGLSQDMRRPTGRGCRPSIRREVAA